ncbi:J domain-containing protein [Qipengyuania sphaerica]|uniref:J domain-containing protein n=1 Tax=Qipengyuania sphaerica TaxID=2867243 RepID=UPI001C872E42|nr:DnaJ domain-containing protein [Qipengyuania sphaerica]MBX7540007.1 DnaJ domain-containing protein [Qipengyuania sphaerica]
MEDDEDFVDLYALFEIEHAATRSEIDKAYRRLAQLYHPDHADTADVEKFQDITRAYKILKSASKRDKYDRLYAEVNGVDAQPAQPRDDIVIDGATAVQDAELHEELLLALYKKRRENAREPGVMPYYLQRELGCSDESFEFHTWYLKSKGLIEISQSSEYMITIEGVDHVITQSRAAKERLLLEQTRHSGS